MRHTPIPATHYVQVRRRLASQLVPGGMVILQSNDVMPTSADGTMMFRQTADMLYLTGIGQEETILVLFPDAYDPRHREVLFVRETNDHVRVWEGYKLSKDEATTLSGIKTVYWTHEFDRIWHTLMCECKAVYLNQNEHVRSVIEVETREARFSARTKKEFPAHTYLRLAPLLAPLRLSKGAGEVAQLQKACDITELGFRRLLEFVRPGVMEYEVEAEMLHEYVRNGSRGFAYNPIVASGANACVLHYNDNDRPCQDGDLMLLDCAAEYGGYASDLTRCIPVNGRFSPRQRQVYEAVLRIHKAAAQMLVPGNNLPDYEYVVGKMMEQELVNLGLLTTATLKNLDGSPAYKRYYPHGTSHHLGLDVHDVGARHATFVPGMVLTVEPGIYIQEEGLGIRIENNFVITEGKPLDLMANIPIEIEEIEAIMNAKH
jgi:Xaa-Pro aminopeptidase